MTKPNPRKRATQKEAVAVVARSVVLYAEVLRLADQLTPREREVFAQTLEAWAVIVRERGGGGTA